MQTSTAFLFKKLTETKDDPPFDIFCSFVSINISRDKLTVFYAIDNLNDLNHIMRLAAFYMHLSNRDQVIGNAIKKETYTFFHNN